MAELVALAFENPYDSGRALTKLSRMQKEYLIHLADAVGAVRRPDGRVYPRQSILAGACTASAGLWGGLFGMLIGLLFLNPLIGSPWAARQAERSPAS